MKPGNFDRIKTPIGVMLIAVLALLSSSCATIGYYRQSVTGHMSIWMGRQDIADMLSGENGRPITPAKRRWLLKVLKIRAFSTEALHLPANYSFKSYTNIRRKHVVWNVVAAPEFSLKPKLFCFVMMGCLSYKGYFAEKNAQALAKKLKAQGYDVYVGGVSAYSTLGWFADPVLSNFTGWSEDVLAGLMFHELAHQVVYIKGDTVFNESFATAVEMEGIKRWTKHRSQPGLSKQYKDNKQRERQFIALVLKFRKRLKLLYATKQSDSIKRIKKQKIISAMRKAYIVLRKKWGGYKGYDRWMSSSLNNAKLASVSTYHKYVPAFQKLLMKSGYDMKAFYREVARIGEMPAAQRHRVLDEMKN